MIEPTATAWIKMNWPLLSSSVHVGLLVAETEEHCVESLFIKKTIIGWLIRQAGEPGIIQRPGALV
jgi:hypothetical protein